MSEAVPPARTARGTKARWGRMAAVGAGFLGLYILGQFIADMLIQRFDLVMSVRTEPMFHRLIMTASAAYIGLTAVPFMPGAEVGISMILIFGYKISFLVYISTVVALIPPYLVGRLLPPHHCARVFKFLGLTRPRRLVEEIAPLSAEERLALLLDRTPGRIGPFLLRHRFLALGILLNVPGNTLIGGGGGIAMMAGFTRLYPLPAYLLTVALAVAPVPLAITLTEFSL